MIQLKQVGKAFGNTCILEQISVEIREGETLCIVGQSGSGKSVLMKLITGLLPVSSGSLWIENQDVTHFSEEQWNKLRVQFGVVFQQSALLDSQTVLENVGIRLFEAKQLTHKEIKQKVMSVLSAVGLQPDILDRLPAQLSGGMRKRVGIARAIIHEPRYLFYDEPTTGLDPVSAEWIDALMEKIAIETNTTSIIITHDMDTVRRLADSVLMIANKHIRFWGSRAEFISSEDKLVQAFLNRTHLEIE